MDVPEADSTQDMENHEYKVPKKEIYTMQDMPKWEKSEAYQEYMGFVMMINECVKGKKISTPCHVSQVVENIVELLKILDIWIDETPPLDQPQRFGNKAFRIWFDRLKNAATKLLSDALPPHFHPAVIELEQYLVESFGNNTRIDYGTGHEMAFVMFICCLFKIKAFTEDDAVAVAFKIFNRYLELMRKLQMTYRMEPAGSHGVWSLDDYHFLPFVWGSSQLIDHPRLLPSNFPNEDVAEAYSKDYMFLGCIKFIMKVKTGPFPEHSNQLWNISAVGSWSKINGGLLKMYKAEALSKFPVVQHVLFGSLLPIRPATTPAMPGTNNFAMPTSTVTRSAST